MISKVLSGFTMKKTSLIASSVLAVGYLIYFDYMRRHSPDFRERIEKQKRDVYLLEHPSGASYDHEKLKLPMEEFKKLNCAEFIINKLSEGEFYAKQGPECIQHAADIFAQAVYSSSAPNSVMEILKKYLPAEIYSQTKYRLSSILSLIEQMSGGSIRGA